MSAQNAARRALIVDDAQHVVRVLRRVFEEAGFEVSTALDGEEALSLIRRGHYDAMITDISMPVMDGEELCRELATSGPYLPQCLFIVTSVVGERERSWVEKYPWISLVEKPVGPRHLLRLVLRRLGACEGEERSDRAGRRRKAA